MKTIIASVVIAIALIGGAFLLSRGGSSNTPVAKANNVTIVNGKQIVEIDVKGGYYPVKSVAKAGIPTIVRFKTSGTFDCSSAVRIPSMNVSKNLPQTGTTDIELASTQAGILQGVCGMGMYPFQIDFQG